MELEAKVAYAAGKLGAPEDIGGLAVFIAPYETAFVIGASLLVDDEPFVNL